MNIQLAAGILAIATSLPMAHGAAEIDPNLQSVIDGSGNDARVKALLYLHQQLDYDMLNDQFKAERASRSHRHQIAMELLQDTAAATQSDLLLAIEAMQAEGSVDSHRAFWIANMIQVEATADALMALSQREDVMAMYLDHPIELVEPVEVNGSSLAIPSRGGPEPGVSAVRAPECWAAGYDGSGVLVANMDTGVEGSHPALASRWRGNEPGYQQEWAWFDPYLNQFPPYDNGGHGTHTMGTIVGGAPGLEIGVAPGAQWIASAPIDRNGISQTVSDAILSFQWMTDPDGNPATSWDVPNVCSNSWGLVSSHGYPECDQTFWTYLDNCELMGTVILFSAGNEASSGLRRPGDRALDEYRTCAVAAIDPYSSSWPVASFSSRGPTYCTEDGMAAIKPDISAPGVSTNSAYLGGSYSQLNGTSMASPHVNGVVALMCQANPDLAPDAIKQIMYDTATDLGTPGKDNDYGWGMVDAWESLQAALATVSLTFDYPDGRPDLIEPTGGQELRVLISGVATADPSSAMLHTRVSGSLWTTTEVDHVIGDVYRIIFPEFPCGSAVEWYVSVETTDGDYATSPFSAPDGVFGAEAISGIDVILEENFESDLGWTVSGDAATGMWERAEPSGGGVRCEPAADSDGSGRCFVTGNSSFDEDIDGGSVILVSPAMEAPIGGVLSYSRWFNSGANCGGAAPGADVFVVDYSLNGGSTWQQLEIVGPTGEGVDGGWINASFVLADVPGFVETSEFRLRFTASDLGEGSVVEAGVDAVALLESYCNDSAIPGDFNEDGAVDVADLLFVIAGWDDPYTVDDLLSVIANWGS